MEDRIERFILGAILGIRHHLGDKRGIRLQSGSPSNLRVIKESRKSRETSQGAVKSPHINENLTWVVLSGKKYRETNN